MTTHDARSRASKGYKGMAMEGSIATWYARITQKDIEEFKKTARTIAGDLPARSSVLELAPGPGYLALELARLGDYRITGLDISQTFVEIAQHKAREAGVEIDFQHGNASQMPFGDSVFDRIVCRSAFKNFAEPIRALNEMQRVLKPGGKAVIFDLRGDASEAEINRYVDNMGLGAVNALITKLTFKFMLIPRAYTPANFEKMVSRSRFKDCEIRTDPIGLAVSLKK